MQKFPNMPNILKKSLILLLLSALFITAKANDGSFYSSGNHLIPIVETDISVKKEVLKIVRGVEKNEDFDRSYFEVTVYYEFFNPSKEKDLIVGFEAGPPYDAGDLSRYPDHPFIFNFKAVMNGVELPYEVAHVPYKFDEDSNMTREKGDYYKDGHFQNLSLKECQNPPFDEDDYPFDDWFYYVYHFNAHFNPGLNTIQHTYRFDGSGNVMTEYQFDYVLTAANRWANNSIDDFTLEIDMGDLESFALYSSFFKGFKDWTFNGRGKVGIGVFPPYYSAEDEGHPIFHVQEGSIVFHKTNFHPDGELYITKPNTYGASELENPISQMYLSLDDECYSIAGDEEDMDADRKRIMKNLPFAYHGYVFKTKSLQQFFESTKWYVPNPEFKGTMESLSAREQRWVTDWSK